MRVYRAKVKDTKHEYEITKKLVGKKILVFRKEDKDDEFASLKGKVENPSELEVECVNWKKYQLELLLTVDDLENGDIVETFAGMKLRVDKRNRKLHSVLDLKNSIDFKEYDWSPDSFGKNRQKRIDDIARIWEGPDTAKSPLWERKPHFQTIPECPKCNPGNRHVTRFSAEYFEVGCLNCGSLWKISAVSTLDEPWET